MKKNLLYLVCIMFSLHNAVNAQQQKFPGSKIVPLKNPQLNKAVKRTAPITGEEIIPFQQVPLPAKHGNLNSPTGIWSIIGTTTYDLQTNSSTLNTVYNDGNNIGAAWTYSAALISSFTDRGTGYNHSSDNGINWQASPVAALEPYRAGWGNLGKLGSGECVLSHKNTDSLGFFSRPVQGTGLWIKTGLVPPDAFNFIYSLWPRMSVGGASGNSVHVIALTTPVANGGALFNGIDGALTYSRSQDGGVTWNLNNILLPDIDALHYVEMSADEYAIDAKGNTIAVVHGGLWTDWTLWKSVDDGTTWNKTVIKAFPIPAYNPTTMTTDINNDGVIDTVESVDASLEVLIDNTGMVHCWAGRTMVMEDSTFTFAFFPFTDGLFYWNESYFNAPPVIITAAIDVDSSGTIDIGPGTPNYTGSITSMPTAGIDAASNIFLAYASVVENTDNGIGESYRNIYCMASPDNGNSWSAPVNISNSNFDESVFPSMARDVDANIHIVWQMDAEPGNSINEGDPIAVNDIIYDLEDTVGIFQGITPSPHFANRLQGNVFYDINQNGIKEAGDIGMPQQKLRLLPDSVLKFTNAFGDYEFRVDTGIYTVEYVPDPVWQLTSDSASFTVHADSVLFISGLDFGAYGSSPVYDLISSITGGWPRCNSNVNYWIDYTNTGNTTIDSGTVTLVKETLMGFVSSTPPYNYAIGDTFVWNFTNLLPYEHRQVYIVLSIGPPLVQGDTIENCVTVYYNDGITARTSSDCVTQIVTCSMDPNDKMVEPAGIGLSHFTLLSDTLEYTIRFQNTGTDTAFTVRIKDTLDAALDINTFRLIGNSHTVQTTIQNNGALEFLFDNILLPDSNVNEPASHGFVKYIIKAKAGTSNMTAVENTAHIFFDFNPPVATNTTLNTLVNTVSVSEISAEAFKAIIYPNPFNESALLVFENKNKEKFIFEMYDFTGRKVRQIENIVSGELTIKKENLSGGLYLSILKNSEGHIYYCGKLIIE